MGYNEADTRAKLIDPILHSLGWTEDLIRRERTAGTIEIVNGKPKRKSGRTDYLLCLPVDGGNPLPVAVLEAKKEEEHCTVGLEQARQYAKRLNVAYVFSTNGHLFVEYDDFNQKISKEVQLEKFPTPSSIRELYQKRKGIDLSGEKAQALFVPYRGGQAERRYYQDAAIRAALEKIASTQKGNNRVLLSLATGAGKTRIAVQLLHKLEQSGQLKRALFVCDRNELRRQGFGRLFSTFGDDAVEFSKSAKWQNARLIVATYQSLGLDEEGDESYFLRTFKENYFSHIIIDECHRSAWNKWSLVLTRNPEAIQIGLTATPRKIVGEKSSEKEKDEQISKNNIKYFGEPVYEYPYILGWEDGYLAACEIVKRRVSIDDEQLTRETLLKKGVYDAKTGKPLQVHDVKEVYDKKNYDNQLILPERRKAMCVDLLKQFEETGGIKQKSIIFCVNDKHAEDVANELNNLYVEKKLPKCEKFAFKFTAKTFDGGGSDEPHDVLLDHMRGRNSSHFIATTVDLLSTGVDIPCIQNIIFFVYVKSPINFYQMVGRGTRIDEASDKYMFRIYDYTNASRLFGKEFLSKVRQSPSKPTKSGEKQKIATVHGFKVAVHNEGTFILMKDDETGKEKPVTIEEYKAKLADSLVHEVENMELLREMWISPDDRRHLIDALPGGEQGAKLLRKLLHLDDCDLFDLFAEIGFGVASKTREERVLAFDYKNKEWLNSLPADAGKVIRALAKQFQVSGIEELESSNVFDIADVRRAGGIKALAKIHQELSQIITDVKKRLLAV